MPSVLTVIVTYNGARWIRRSIGSVLMDSSIRQDVLVIDNASTDGTAEIVRGEFPSVCLIQSRENLGFGRANNLGLTRALGQGYEHVFLLNQDAWFVEGCIADLARLQKKHPMYGILSPVHLDGQGESLDRMFGQYLASERCRGLLFDALRNRLKPVYEVEFVNAAAWLISRECLESVGGFDPLFRHYGEDNDYAARARSMGFRLGVAPHVFVCHDRPQANTGSKRPPDYREVVMYLATLKRPDWSTRYAVRAVLSGLIGRIVSQTMQGKWATAARAGRVFATVVKTLPRVVASRREMAGSRCPYLERKVDQGPETRSVRDAGGNKTAL